MTLSTLALLCVVVALLGSVRRLQLQRDAMVRRVSTLAEDCAYRDRLLRAEGRRFAHMAAQLARHQRDIRDLRRKLWISRGVS